MANGTVDLPDIVVTPGEGDTPGTTPGSQPGSTKGSGTGTARPTDENKPQPDVRNYPPYLGRAVVIINGAEYWEWESVYVRLAKYETPANTFRFTCSEQEQLGQDFTALRIIPGDKCEIRLDGEVAITGEVVTRQVFYDATNHTVELQGQGETGRMNEGAVVSQTGEFKNITFQQLAQTVAGQFGLGVTGTADSAMKFPRVSVQPGESAWELLERHARAANTIMGESSTGQLELGLNPGGSSVIEGVNIIEGRERIHSLKSVGGGEPGMTGGGGGGAGSDFKTVGQAPGNDDEWGANPTHQRQNETGALTSTFNQGFLPKVGLSEIPAWANSMLAGRGAMERNVSDTMQINVTVVTLGWQRNAAVPPVGGLWKPGDTVTVHSPMLVMYHRPLTLKAVTFSQDNNSGTRSTLELVNAASMGGEAQMTGGK